VQFIVDAQLPDALVRQLVALGHDAVHVKELPDAGDTPDAAVIAFADREGRVVVTKDNDFRYSHEVHGRPARLLHVALGNMRNRDLLAHISAHQTDIIAAFEIADFVELGATGLTLHRPRPPADEQTEPQADNEQDGNGQSD
jgi:predicted nuclease of predicted toxin-antitoxin system